MRCYDCLTRTYYPHMHYTCVFIVNVCPHYNPLWYATLCILRLSISGLSARKCCFTYMYAVTSVESPTQKIVPSLLLFSLSVALHATVTCCALALYVHYTVDISYYLLMDIVCGNILYIAFVVDGYVCSIVLLLFNSLLRLFATLTKCILMYIFIIAQLKG